MNKSGKILLLEPDSEISGYLCDKLHTIANKNEVLCCPDSKDAVHYLSENARDVFLVLHNFSSPGFHLPNCRNMVYMHEKFNIESIAYMFLVQRKEDTVKEGLHTFIHCYYKPMHPEGLPKVFNNIIDFWKDHVFPASVIRRKVKLL